MYEIKTLNKIATCGTDIFDKAKYTVSDNAENPTAIMVRSAKMHDMEMPESLLAIARAGAGVNNIPVEKCAEQGIVVFNTPGANSNAVKELAICALLLSSRKITEAAAWAASLKGTPDAPKTVEGGKSKFAGPEILGKTLGVIGLGAIGGKIANAAVALGMDVIGYDPYLSVHSALQLSRHVKCVNDPKAVYEAADFITIHVPLMDPTRNTINAETIAMMKDGVKILNFARGGLVNNDDIKAALKSGKVSKYIVDFPDAETVNCDGIIAIPHLGASTEESEDNCAMMAAQEIKDYLENGNITNSVNFPNCTLQSEAAGRVAIAHRNIPKVIAQYTDILSDVNISDMINKSKGDVAYTIINTDHAIPADAVEKLKGLDSVLSVRVIK